MSLLNMISVQTIESLSDTVAVMENEISSTAVAAAQPLELSVWELCIKGGFIMIPLAILLLISIYIFIERYIVISRADKQDASFMKRIKDYIHEGEIESAKNLCKKTDTPYSRLILKGITRIGRPMNDVLVAIENTGNLEIANLGKGLPWLATTAAGAPMLGFLGTVVGMVEAFFALANAGSSANVTVLAGGIYEALVTTVAGLTVGIIALFAYNALVARINGVMKLLEGKTMEFMDLLNEPA
ncbi:MAG: MotA/TolQ/ExbB proton channel family protein [Bacteroides sp.]|nr:MotA/TolQ/ExbB proton channel family protein [Lachnospiraceae bacterium]MCM1332034.1 MotA/TolQ/ExbB proton channel family protein [Bacteroides sp.]MCM1390194.1 MotA/TolQ/ExbB proton channel family protein [Bacteroides sp.]